MHSFVFWNIAGKCSLNVVDEAVKHLDADFVIIAEDCLNINQLLPLLNTNSRKVYQFRCNNRRRISIYAATENGVKIELVSTDNPYILPVQIITPIQKTLLIGIHLPSKLRTDNNERQFVSRKVAGEIISIESRLGHKNTVVVGDFNMNPLEDGIVSVDAFNAVMSKDIAKKKKGVRKHAGKSYDFFYNPMWGHFGDLSDTAPGTYYYAPSDYKNKYYWNMFDQILIRPSIIDSFDWPYIIDEIKVGRTTKKLLSKGRSFKINESDHLPLFFQIKI